jgi:hypothetical protein
MQEDPLVATDDKGGNTQDVQPVCVAKAHLLKFDGGGHPRRLAEGYRCPLWHLLWYLHLAPLARDARSHLLRRRNQLDGCGLDGWENLGESETELAARQRGITVHGEGAVHLGMLFILMDNLNLGWSEAAAECLVKKHHAVDFAAQHIESRCLFCLVSGAFRPVFKANDAFRGGFNLDRSRLLFDRDVQRRRAVDMCLMSVSLRRRPGSCRSRSNGAHQATHEGRFAAAHDHSPSLYDWMRVAVS